MFTLYAKLCVMLLICIAGYAMHRIAWLLSEEARLETAPEVYRIREADRLSLSQTSDPLERELIIAKIAADAREYSSR